MPMYPTFGVAHKTISEIRVINYWLYWLSPKHIWWDNCSGWHYDGESQWTCIVSRMSYVCFLFIFLHSLWFPRLHDIQTESPPTDGVCHIRWQYLCCIWQCIQHQQFHCHWWSFGGDRVKSWWNFGGSFTARLSLAVYVVILVLPVGRRNVFVEGKIAGRKYTNVVPIEEVVPASRTPDVMAVMIPYLICCEEILRVCMW